MNKPRLKIAVIGSGIAGIASAYLLSKKHEVTLFEKEGRLGGHTNTVELQSGPDAGLGVDTGFIVCNDRTYPLLHSLFREWEVPVRNADMSFGYHDEKSGMTYGSKNLDMLFAKRSNIVNLSFLQMVLGIGRFWRELPRDCNSNNLQSKTLREFLGSRYSQSFVEHYLKPFAGAIWSASGTSVLDMPAELCARFFMNHGMLSYNDNPQWQTVVGGSHSYLKAFSDIFTGTVKLSSGVKTVIRSDQQVQIVTEKNESHVFDRVILATHADQALTLLAEPTPDEKRLLSPWKYSKNYTVLHTDRSLLPPMKRGVAAWNYRRFLVEDKSKPVCVTYHMNTLQGFNSKTDYCVTLNPRREVPPDNIIAAFNYTHPEFSQESFATQDQLPILNGKQNTWFAGSYFRWGFHEDAVRSAFAVAADFGVKLGP